MHNIANIDGQDQVMLRQDAWHRLGTVVGEEFSWLDAVSANMAITRRVAKVPLREIVSGGIQCSDDQHAAVRYDPLTNGSQLIFAGHGEQWTPFQAEEAYEFGNALRDEADTFGMKANLVSLGLLGPNGGAYFMTYALGEFDILGYEVKDYLTVSGSWDGTRLLQALTSPTLVVCENTLVFAAETGMKHYRFKHTSGIANRVEEAKAALERHRANVDVYGEQARELASVNVDHSTYRGLVNELFPITADVPTRTRTKNERARTSVRALFEGADDMVVTPDGFGFVQAVNTWENWGVPIRKTKGMNEGDVRAIRQLDAVTSGRQPYTQKAQRAVLAVA